jgi:uncharacterized membrane protein YgcG
VATAVLVSQLQLLAHQSAMQVAVVVVVTQPEAQQLLVVAQA